MLVPYSELFAFLFLFKPSILVMALGKEWNVGPKVYLLLLEKPLLSFNILVEVTIICKCYSKTDRFGDISMRNGIHTPIQPSRFGNWAMWTPQLSCEHFWSS